MALVKFSAEPRQLSHDLYEIALCFCILVLDFFFLIELFGKGSLQDSVLFECMSQFYLVLLDYPTSYLLVDSLSLRS